MFIIADLRGGSTIGGRPILGKEARDNYIGKIVGNKLKESLLYDDGSTVKLGGNLTVVGTVNIGNATIASGSYSHAEGQNSVSSGTASHAEGNATTARSDYSHVEGQSTLGANGYLFKILTYDNTAKTITLDSVTNLAVGDLLQIQINASNALIDVPITAINGNVVTLNTTAVMSYTWAYVVKLTSPSYPVHAEGTNTVASGNHSHSEGINTVASGSASHAEGSNTIASGNSSHAEGNSSIASGNQSHAEGFYAIAEGTDSHAEGNNTTARSDYSHTEGRYTLGANGTLYNITAFDDVAKTITLNNVTGLVVGDLLQIKVTNSQTIVDVQISVISGNVITLNTTATMSSTWKYAVKLSTAPTPVHAEGINTVASGNYTHAEGFATLASGDYSHAEGINSIASGLNSHAEGNNTTASGTYSHAEGTSTTASNNYTHAEGNATQASGSTSHAEGISTIASGTASHAEGNSTTASGMYSHAEGNSSTAGGSYAHSEGTTTVAKGIGSHAEGTNVNARSDYSHAEGQYTLGANGTLYTITAFDDVAKTITLDNASGLVSGSLLQIKVASAQSIMDIQVSAVSGTTVTLNTTLTITSSWKNAIKLNGNGAMYVVHAEGSGTIASGNYSHAEGSGSIASGSYSHAEGSNTIASGSYSHAEGNTTTASGSYAHAEGNVTVASGSGSHAEGVNVSAKSSYSHAEGQYTLGANGVLYKITAFDNTAKTITLDNVTGLIVGDLLQIKVSSAQSILDVPISAISGNVVTLNTTQTITSSWTHAIEIASTVYPVHVEGLNTIVSGNNSHAEGQNAIATGQVSHAEGFNTLASGNQSHAEGGTTVASNAYSHSEGSSTTASGNSSHAEGSTTIASGNYTHAEGYNTTASGVYAHSEGSYTTASGSSAHAEGNNTNASGGHSHAEGNYTTARSHYSHAEGQYTLGANGVLYNIIAFNDTAKTITLDNVTGLLVGDLLQIKVTGAQSIMDIPISAISGNTVTLNTTQTISSSWVCAIELATTSVCPVHSEGFNTVASGNYSHAEGNQTTANVINSHTMGQFNKTLTGSATTYSGTADAFVIGNGTSSTALGNAFRVTFGGASYGLSAFNSTGADYAEYFEWVDKNIDNEDRVGYFVTLDGSKIRKADSTDSYILGIISATPSVIGDSYQDDWNEKYITDDWGRIQYNYIDVPEITDTILHPAEYDENGEVVKEEYSETVIVQPARQDYVPQLNPNWNPDQEYIPREKRKEWSPVGMMGKLLVRDDGTCVVNGYCKSNDEGIGTASINGGYRVMERISENIVRVLIN